VFRISDVNSSVVRKYLAAHHDGTLPEEVSQLARLIKEDPGLVPTRCGKPATGFVFFLSHKPHDDIS